MTNDSLQVAGSRAPLAELPLDPFVRAAQQGQELLLAENINKASSAAASGSASGSASPSSSSSSKAYRHTGTGKDTVEPSFSRHHHHLMGASSSSSASQPHSPVKPSPLSPHHHRHRHQLRPPASIGAAAPGTPSGKLFESELSNRTLPVDGADELERSPATVPDSLSGSTKKKKMGKGILLRQRRERETSPSPCPSPSSEGSPSVLGRGKGKERERTPVLQVGTEARNERPHKDQKFGMKDGAAEELGVMRASPPTLVVEQEEVDTSGSPSAERERRAHQERSASSEGAGEASATVLLAVSGDIDMTAVPMEKPPVTPTLGCDSEVAPFEAAFEGATATTGGLANLARKKDRVRASEVVQAHKEAGISPSPRKKQGSSNSNASTDTASSTALLGSSLGEKGFSWDGVVLEDSEEELEMAISGAYAVAAFEARKERREARAGATLLHGNNKGKEKEKVVSGLVKGTPKLSAKRMAPRMHSKEGMLPPSATRKRKERVDGEAVATATTTEDGTVSAPDANTAPRDQASTPPAAPAAPTPTALDAIDEDEDELAKDGKELGRPTKVRRSE
ncbi:hypothetical protein A4X13_0g1790 [Tilletia indica]|uniref:Uncharacterized protein n=1 Tax=Tilletia indica TaxID=43049 RepID=A0A177TPR9_9BASI|nr:hypothetical protein A4X13_0g1790 [Tilletia indica]